MNKVSYNVITTFIFAQCSRSVLCVKCSLFILYSFNEECFAVTLQGQISRHSLYLNCIASKQNNNRDQVWKLVAQSCRRLSTSAESTQQQFTKGVMGTNRKLAYLSEYN